MSVSAREVPDRHARRIAWFVPRPVFPERGGGDVRSAGLIRAALGAGHRVLLIQPAWAGAPQKPDGLGVVNVPCRRGVGLAAAKLFSKSPLRSARPTPAGRRLVECQIGAFDPELLVVSDLFSWPVARTVAGEVPWIFDDHNVEALLYRQFAENAVTLFDRVTFEIDQRRIERLEPRLVAASSAVVAVSEEDARFLARVALPRRAPLVVPSSVPTPAEPAPVTDEPVLLFVGSLNHPPNVEAVRELVRVLLPTIRQSVPDTRLVVAGRTPSAELKSLLAAADGVELREGLADLGPVYREARCTVMPIRSGSGSRLKVYEALAYGLPAVGTAQAFAGVDLAGCALTAETAEDLVTSAVQVLRDDGLAHSLSVRSRQHFLERLSWQHAAAPLLDLIEELT